MTNEICETPLVANRLTKCRIAKKVFNAEDYNSDYKGVLIHVFAPTVRSWEGIKSFLASNKRAQDNDMNPEDTVKYLKEEAKMMQHCVELEIEGVRSEITIFEIESLPFMLYQDIIALIMELGDIPLPDSLNGKALERSTELRGRRKRGQKL